MNFIKNWNSQISSLKKINRKKMQRVLVGLKKNGDLRIPKFSECILDFFTKDSNVVHVSCELEDDMLVIAPNPNGYKLQHSPECPLKVLAENEQRGGSSEDIKPEKKALNINIAVSMVIETSDNYVLLTRRPSHMRSSPRVWVPPGGHLELGETLLEGGAREVREETGLRIENATARILCLWENVYPIILGFGAPTNHVLVVYFHVKMRESRGELQERIKLDPQEVESFCWLNSYIISELFKNRHEHVVEKQYVLEDGRIVEKDLDVSSMFNWFLWTKPESYSGAQYALRNWLQEYGSSQQGPQSKI